MEELSNRVYNKVYASIKDIQGENTCEVFSSPNMNKHRQPLFFTSGKKKFEEVSSRNWNRMKGFKKQEIKIQFKQDFCCVAFL